MMDVLALGYVPTMALIVVFLWLTVIIGNRMYDYAQREYFSELKYLAYIPVVNMIIMALHIVICIAIICYIFFIEPFIGVYKRYKT